MYSQIEDIKELFTKIQDNRLKHEKLFKFTIDKYDCNEDESAELDLDKLDECEDQNPEIDFDKLDDEFEEELLGSSDSDSDENDPVIQKKIITNYCQAIKDQITSTPIYPETKTPKKINPILNGISPFLQNKFNENKLTTRQSLKSTNILNIVRERNLMNKINIENNDQISNNKERLKPSQENNRSIILCKPTSVQQARQIFNDQEDNLEKNNEKEIPYKLNFDFDSSGDETNDGNRIEDFFDCKNTKNDKNVKKSPPIPMIKYADKNKSMDTINGFEISILDAPTKNDVMFKLCQNAFDKKNKNDNNIINSEKIMNQNQSKILDEVNFNVKNIEEKKIENVTKSNVKNTELEQKRQSEKRIFMNVTNTPTVRVDYLKKMCMEFDSKKHTKNNQINSNKMIIIEKPKIAPKKDWMMEMVRNAAVVKS